jgi:uncharacterized protein DUF2183
MSALRLRRTRAAGAARPVPLVCRWDLDKTYLRSDFDSLRQLLRTAFERAEDKVDVPGVAELIKGLKRSGEQRGRPVQIHFLSASPPQIGKAIRAKLALDGIPYDDIVFKDQLQHLRRGRLRNLREHVGFKLAELLRGRLAAPPESRELCFGDDWESDSLIYSLYGDVAAGRLPPARLAPVLRRIRVDPRQIDEVLALAARATGADAVARIFINLEKRTPPGAFQLFGPRVVPTFNYFQTAAVLAADGNLETTDLVRVGHALLAEPTYTPRRLENSLDDLVRRGHVSAAAATALATRLRAEDILPPPAKGRPRWRRALAALGHLRQRPAPRSTRTASLPSPPPGALDYDAILDRLHPTTRPARAARSEAP